MNKIQVQIVSFDSEVQVDLAVEHIVRKVIQVIPGRKLGTEQGHSIIEVNKFNSSRRNKLPICISAVLDLL